MQRGTKTVAASEAIRLPLTRGNAFIVDVEGTGVTGTVDFESSIDGTSWSNHPYWNRHAAAPARSVAQISDPSTFTSYVISPPLAAFRINIALSAGSIAVTWREIDHQGEVPA